MCCWWLMDKVKWDSLAGGSSLSQDARTADGVGGRHDGAARLEGGDDAGLGHGDGLLLQRLYVDRIDRGSVGKPTMVRASWQESTDTLLGRASWMEVRSASFILSNSSMRHMPRSASTSAPPSSVHSFVIGSLCTPAFVFDRRK